MKQDSTENVTINMPSWLVEELDVVAESLSVSRRELIIIWLNDGLARERMLSMERDNIALGGQDELLRDVSISSILSRVHLSDAKGVKSSEIKGSWLGPCAAMAAFGCSRASYNRMCRDGLLKAKKFGRTWYVHKSEFE